MKFLTLAVVLAATPSLVAAAADAADPAAAVPRLSYRSPFQGIPKGVEEESVPWKKANEDVAQFPRGHVDLLKWEEAQGGRGKPAAPVTAPTPAASSPTPAPQAPRGHQH